MPTPAYEAVPYEDRPVTETHLDQLYVAARRAGLAAARPEHARVLELGCAHAVNLVPMAFHLPEARFLGLDRSPGQIERATRRIAALGLSNLELRQADVLDVDLGDQRFDYIIAHGLFSWVPEPVRQRVLALCREHLTDTGVAYLSYNAMPAWGIRGAIRQALLQAVDLRHEPPEQLRCARAVLEQLAQIQPLHGTAEGALLAAELEGLRDKPDAYLLHEYLVPETRAFYLQEVVERVEHAGLQWLGDVAPTGLPPRVLRATRNALRALSRDPLVVEQLADIVGFRQFRASLLCPAPAALAPTPAALLLDGHLAAPPAEPDPADTPHEAAILHALAERWPADLPFAALASALALEPAALVELLWALVDDERVQLRPRALPIAAAAGPNPRVAALSRFEAAHLPFVTTPRHEHAPLDAFHAALIGHLDGRPRAAVAAALVDDILAGRLRLASEALPPVEQLRAALPSLVDAGLQRLHAAGLLLV
jgi:Predicted methyltransferase regulatory domain/Methyltransferase domain